MILLKKKSWLILCQQPRLNEKGKHYLVLLGVKGVQTVTKNLQLKFNIIYYQI